MSNGSPRIALVMGLPPPHDMCGVGEYVSRLHAALSDQYPVEIVRLPLARRWDPKLFRLARTYDLLHIHYPGQAGYRSVSAPALSIIGPRTKIVLTFHEWSDIGRLRRATVRPLVRRANAYVFVQPSEEIAFKAKGKKRDTRKPSFVIPVGLNLMPNANLSSGQVLDFRKSLLAPSENDILLTHFGLINAGKQWLRLFDALDNLRSAGRRPLLIFVGDFTSDKSREAFSFRREIMERGLEPFVRMAGFVRDETLASLIMASGDANISLYSDGLSSRRSSFWFAAQHGSHLITTEPRHPEEFGAAERRLGLPQVRFVARRAVGSDVADAIRELPPFRPLRFPPIPAPSWESIAEGHAQMYRSLLGQ